MAFPQRSKVLEHLSCIFVNGRSLLFHLSHVLETERCRNAHTFARNAYGAI
jgi:hypothetical protein